ncbi:TetR/AcrR family transcriptional regulator [Nocardiopsis dassonvillei]|uniref:Transcriptional regulator, TetR family n=1 Tax=Nocardiopsis dassonvillei (strain ATCC 23218 / DSM 43111 / CIP 107115 / JCM 7437 / KCTC 9190 / NBRC 14626 / NCTC 10488 / NRRL B-5397 / IMRU 509) TaxID=446468 RepID=D7B3T3_NOCDD|nr:transcriptional regulator, TetR family [Nocardiopsis dassonvillei subsp. dassonvillei DSM 43111]NKY79214.1 TetR/AcrR family transcriptional regulator [Nocardiopsis dassonvillei]VEI89359.1 Bacterial regulatory proteins, tetR family [Nocardiopsis dassonvillei]
MAEEPRTVWNRPERGTRGPAPLRDRAQITAAAIELADGGGLAAVSMRQVAERLGTGPASLYRYVSTRGDLLDLMADAVTGEIELGDPLSGDPVEDLAALAGRAKQVYLSHPWLLDLPTEPVLGPRGMDYLECTLRALAPTSLSYTAQLETIGLVNGLVALFARTELSRRNPATDPRHAHASHLAAAATEERHPLITTALAHRPAVEAPQDAHVLFERMVRRVLTGLVDTP